MDWLWYVLLIVLQLAGLVLNLLGMPGLWVMVGATGVFAWVTWHQGYVGVVSLIVLLLLAIAAEIVEFIAGSAGAKKAGASKLGMFGAVVGGVIGAILGTFIPVPVVGTIVGACAGSFLGSMGIEWYRRGDVSHSVRVGWGAAKGRFFGILAKTGFGLAILLITLVVAFPYGGKTRAATNPLFTPPPATVPATQPASRPASFL
jgi:hypothetical protein